MIHKIHIENFKSIETLTIPLGRINVFIGENGCGKSNILEAICMASAAKSNKLDNEFLVSRGIRLAEPSFMRSAFDKTKSKEPLFIEVEDEDEYQASFRIQNDNKAYSKWYADTPMDLNEDIPSNMKSFLSQHPHKDYSELLHYLIAHKIVKNIKKIFDNFIIYSPENSALRAFHREGQVEPLGINGEGLFKLLKVLSAQDKLGEIKEYLKCMGWFEDFLIINHNDELRENVIHVNGTLTKALAISRKTAPTKVFYLSCSIFVFLLAKTHHNFLP